VCVCVCVCVCVWWLDFSMRKLWILCWVAVLVIWQPAQYFWPCIVWSKSWHGVLISSFHCNVSLADSGLLCVIDSKPYLMFLRVSTFIGCTGKFIHVIRFYTHDTHWFCFKILTKINLFKNTIINLIISVLRNDIVDI